MMLKPDQERVRTLLKDTITLLCRNGLSFNAKFCIDAVIGVTLDDRELFYMSMNEVIKSEKAQLAEQEANNEEESEVDEGSHKRRLGKEPRKRHKNKRPRIKNEEGGSSSEEERLESVTHEDDDESYTGSGNFQAEGGVDDASSDPQNSLMMGVKREQDKDDDENNDIVFIKEEMDDNWGPSGSNNTSTSQGSFFQGVPGSSNQDSGMFQSGDNQQEQSFGSLSDMNLVPVGSQEGAMMWAQSTSSTQYQGVGRGRGRGRSSMGVTSQGDSSTQPGLDQQKKTTGFINKVDRLPIKLPITDSLDKQNTSTENSSAMEVVEGHNLMRLPPTLKKAAPRRRCRVCYKHGIRKDSVFYCPSCPEEPGLCETPCFQIYHNRSIAYNAAFT